MVQKYRCVLCGNEIKKMFKSSNEEKPFLSCQCGGIMEKQIPQFSTSSYEEVDTGSMAKKVMLRKDAAEKSYEKGDVYIKEMKERESVLGIEKDETED